MKPKLRGWVPVGGKSRRYRNAKGETISRRQYENKVLKRKGWRSRYEAEQFRESEHYKRAKYRMRRAKKGKRRTLTIFDDYAAFLRDVDWELVDRNWEAIKAEGRARRVDPDSLLADNLVLLGLRKPEWQWNVGETAQGVTAIG